MSQEQSLIKLSHTQVRSHRSLRQGITWHGPGGKSRQGLEKHIIY